jgi:prepilin-type N-terminal cleavage/methylation domain-containing protein
MAAGRRRADERGLTLIEICVTVAILGIALVPMMMSVAAASKTSDFIAQRSAAEGYARELVEMVRSDAVPQACAASGQTWTATYQANVASALAAAGKASTDFDFNITRVTGT